VNELAITAADLVTFGLLTLALAALWLPQNRAATGKARKTLQVEPWMAVLIAAATSACVGFGRAPCISSHLRPRAEWEDGRLIDRGESTSAQGVLVLPAWLAAMR
jgi:hypothetical protein